MTYVGIDVSKLTFVVAYSSAKTSKTKTFKNTAKGIREFIKTISVDVTILFSATTILSAVFQPIK